MSELFNQIDCVMDKYDTASETFLKSLKQKHWLSVFTVFFFFHFIFQF